MRKIGRGALCINRFRNSMKTNPLTLPFVAMKRRRPRALTAEIMFTELRCPVLYRSEEHTSELQSLRHLVCRLLLEKKNNIDTRHDYFCAGPRHPLSLTRRRSR